MAARICEKSAAFVVAHIDCGMPRYNYNSGDTPESIASGGPSCRLFYRKLLLRIASVWASLSGKTALPPRSFLKSLPNKAEPLAERCAQ